MNYKLFILPILMGTLAVTGCANRKPVDSTTSTTPPTSSDNTGATTQPFDPYANIDQTGGSAIGVTDENRPLLAQRVVHFEYDSSDILGSAYPVLQAHAQFLNANSNSRIALIGHTDERGTREYNMALGERRAKSVEAFLMSNGVNKAQLETVSYGKEQPLNEASNESAWSENRRVEIKYEAVPPLLSAPASR